MLRENSYRLSREHLPLGKEINPIEAMISPGSKRRADFRLRQLQTDMFGKARSTLHSLGDVWRPKSNDNQTPPSSPGLTKTVDFFLGAKNKKNFNATSTTTQQDSSMKNRRRKSLELPTATYQPTTPKQKRSIVLNPIMGNLNTLPINGILVDRTNPQKNSMKQRKISSLNNGGSTMREKLSLLFENKSRHFRRNQSLDINDLMVTENHNRMNGDCDVGNVGGDVQTHSNNGSELNHSIGDNINFIDINDCHCDNEENINHDGNIKCGQFSKMQTKHSKYVYHHLNENENDKSNQCDGGPLQEQNNNRIAILGKCTQQPPVMVHKHEKNGILKDTQSGGECVITARLDLPSKLKAKDDSVIHRRSTTRTRGVILRHNSVEPRLLSGNGNGSSRQSVNNSIANSLIEEEIDGGVEENSEELLRKLNRPRKKLSFREPIENINNYKSFHSNTGDVSTTTTVNYLNNSKYSDNLDDLEVVK